MKASKRNAAQRKAPPLDCEIVPICKRRDGGTRYWCLAHKADATAKYGKRGKACRYSHIPPVSPNESLELTLSDYSGGIAMWGAVPPVYDTTTQPLDRGIHVHARKSGDEHKSIDATYRRVTINNRGIIIDISELDAIYYMVSSIFGFQVKEVHCVRCGYSHLDKDWFSINPHQSHLCSGCGRTFRDSEVGIGNPVAALSSHREHKAIPMRPSRQHLDLKQADFPGGIQIWGSNPAFIWTSERVPESGIHLHAFKKDSKTPDLDDTYATLTIDGHGIDSRQVQLLMAQNALPHVCNRIRALRCGSCGREPFDQGTEGLVPRVGRTCTHCKAPIKTSGGLKKVISNPLISTLRKVARTSVRKPQIHDLGLLPETL